MARGKYIEFFFPKKKNFKTIHQPNKKSLQPRPKFLHPSTQNRDQSVKARAASQKLPVRGENNVGALRTRNKYRLKIHGFRGKI